MNESSNFINVEQQIQEEIAKLKKTKRTGPEAKIVERIIKKLTLLGWYVIVIHGNIFTNGFPDLFACHSKYGIRLIEVKNPKNYSFTAAQLEKFPKLAANGAGVWVLTGDSDEEIEKLFRPHNWYLYLIYKP